MSYPEICFSNLIGITGACQDTPQANFMLDTIPGVDLDKLANLATPNAPTGLDLAKKIINSAARIMAADVEAIYDAQYKVQNTLVNGCSICQFQTNYASGGQKGVLIKNHVESSFSQLVIEKITMKINRTGPVTIVIDDGSPDNVQQFEADVEAGVLTEVTLLGYRTKEKQVRIYLEDDTIPVAALSCPRHGSGCGCSGGRGHHVETDLVYTGTNNGVASTQAYGFIPCAYITCSPDDLLCYVARSAPRMIGLAMLYKATELYFLERQHSTRLNKVAGTQVDDTKADVAKYNKLYLDKLNGSGSRGVKDLVFTTLQQTHDTCVVCNSLVATAWATG